MACDFLISPIAQSPNWPACKELQISELSARKFSLENSLKQSQPLPTPAPFNITAHCTFRDFKVSCLEKPYLVCGFS
jgi:hypothetical protein